MTTKWDRLSIRGRTAYAIMCCERYLLKEYPERDMTLAVQYMWDVVNDSGYIDVNAYRYMDIIPEYLFEADTYEESEMYDMSKEDYEVFVKIIPTREEDPDLDIIMHRIYDVAMRYVYTIVMLDEPDTKEYLQEVEQILSWHGVELPDVNVIPEYVPDKSHGWGDFINGRSLSLILKDERDPSQAKTSSDNLADKIRDTKWDNLSSRERTAYAVVACERYLLTVYPEKDMTLVIRFMLDIVNDSGNRINKIRRAFRFQEIIPENLFLAETYELRQMEMVTKEEYETLVKIIPTAEADPDLNKIMDLVHEIATEYVKPDLRLDDTDTRVYLRAVDEILLRHGVELPDVSQISDCYK